MLYKMLTADVFASITLSKDHVPCMYPTLLIHTIIISGFHHRWNTNVDRRHPSLWVFLRKMKDEQRHVDSLLLQARRGDPAPTQRLKWRRLDKRFENLHNITFFLLICSIYMIIDRLFPPPTTGYGRSG